VPNSEGAIRFGAFTLIPAQRELTRDGIPVRIGDRAMDVLLHLASHPGIVVTKDALLQSVWPGRVVEENNLTVHMTALRKAINDTGQRIIRTVTGRGYVFIGAEAPVSTPPGHPTGRPTARPGLPLPAHRVIGRESALAELRQLAQTRRAITVVGPGGVGKTALALHVAAQIAPGFGDGVAFIDLAAVSDPVRVPEAVAAVLANGAGDNAVVERLISFLQSLQMLLVLDNCEHLVEHVAILVRDILAACPRIVILATSREGLFLNGEAIFRLAPLPFPADPGRADAATALDYDAVRLFVERAETIDGFTLDDANAPIIATICARLDGMPLAIEMAAARLKVLSPAQLAERLDQRFRLLAAAGRGIIPRHRTLQAVIDWSYDLLPPEERTLLRILSTFVGGADLAAIQYVAGATGDDEWALLDRLTGLGDKSLLVVEATPDRRFRLLETIRQYATERVRDAGETHWSARHAACFADRFLEAARIWPDTPDPDWLAAYAGDANNLRAALAWCFGPEGDRALGLRLVASSVPLWWTLPETPLTEGQRWFGTAVAHMLPETPAIVQGWLRLGQSWRDFRFGDQENLAMALQAASLFRAAGDATGLGASLWRAGSASLTRETADQAESCLTEAESVLRGIAPGKWLALTLVRLGDLRFRQGQWTQALCNYQEGFALSRTTQFWIGLVNGGSNMAELLFAQGEPDRALRQLRQLRAELTPSRRAPLMATLSAHLLLAGQLPEMRQVAEEAIDQSAAIGLTAALAWTIEAVALLCAIQGDSPLAARLAGYARAVHPSIATRAGSRKVVAERLTERLGDDLTREDLAAALREGACWTIRQAADAARLPLRSAGGTLPASRRLTEISNF
jgi:predicted ATPase/DNA-binding winged helix-turn-helix (wHTH) protein/tetratricopeptide (TPR) repeat protein